RDLGAGGIVVDEDLELDLVPHLVRLGSRRSNDRDEDAQHEGRDQNGCECGKGRRRVPLERPQRLLQEKPWLHDLRADWTTGSGCSRAATSAVDSLVWIVVQLRREAYEPQYLRHLLADLGPRLADYLEAVRDVVVDRPVLKKLEVLENDSQVAAKVRDLLALELAEVSAGDQDLAPS